MAKITADNESNAREFYEYRKLYKELAWDHGTYSIPNADIWYERQMYGKIDHKKNSIFLSESKLKPLHGSPKSDRLYVLNFVADAFSDFKNYVAGKSFRGQISSGSPYTRMLPAKAWKKAHSALSGYDKMMKTLYLDFARAHVDQRLDEKILNFDDFMKHFFYYFRDHLNAVNIPITLTGHIFNNHLHSPMASGLLIELARARHDNDGEKINSYILDGTFGFFRDAAIRFGFVLDENAPWRLVADLSSAAMKDYMSEYRLTYNNVFDYTFYKAKYLDVKLLNTYLIDFYNTFAIAHPRVGVADFCARSSITFQKTMRRKPLNIPQARFNNVYENTGKYGFLYWAEFYMKVRALEAKSTINDQQMSHYIKNVKKMHGDLDIAHVMTYIDSKIKKTSSIYPWVQDKELLDDSELRLARKQMTEQTVVNVATEVSTPVGTTTSETGGGY